MLPEASEPLLARVRYNLSPFGEMEITNPAAVEGYYRYPDLTFHCIYLAQTLHATITEDMAEELNFLYSYDEAKRELQVIVDMPDLMVDRMIIYLEISSI